MKIKVGMRFLNNLYKVGNVKTRMLMSGVLSSEQMEKFTDRFGTLDKLAEAKDSDIANVLGNSISEATLKEIRVTLDGYYANLIKLDFLTGMPSDVVPYKRINWGRLIEKSEMYGTPINGLQKALNKCSKKEKEFIRLRFGINKNQKVHSYAEISEKLDIPVKELDEFEVKALHAFTSNVLDSRKWFL